MYFVEFIAFLTTTTTKFIIYYLISNYIFDQNYIIINYRSLKEHTDSSEILVMQFELDQ